MPKQKSFAGLRIRERRRSLGLSQTALAEAAGISASYLNLIEHNKRAIAGRVLLALAKALDLPPSALSKEAELSAIGDLRQAAKENTATGVETDLTEEFISRYPGWARLVNSLHRSNTQQRATIDALSDRLAHDPYLQETIHEVLTRVTAVHSIAGILEGVTDLPEERRTRFLRNLFTESGRLAEVAEALTRYFDQTIDTKEDSALPGEEVERFLQARNYHIEELEELKTASVAKSIISDLLNTQAAFENEQTHPAARRILENYARDAQALPLSLFRSAAEELRFDPLALSARFSAPTEQVLRRMASLTLTGREGNRAAFGFIRVNPAGHVLERLPLEGFAMPHHGAACTLWPVFQPDIRASQPVIQPLELPGGQRFESLTLRIAHPVTTLEETPLTTTAMLLVAADDAREMAFARPATAARPVGSGCRICPRRNCSARVEAPILAPIEQ